MPLQQDSTYSAYFKALNLPTYLPVRSNNHVKTVTITETLKKMMGFIMQLLSMYL